MKVAILLNAKAGSLLNQQCEQRAQEILAACQAANIDATTHLCEAAQLTAIARAMARDTDVDAVIAVGDVAAGSKGDSLAELDRLADALGAAYVRFSR